GLIKSLGETALFAEGAQLPGRIKGLSDAWGVYSKATEQQKFEKTRLLVGQAGFTFNAFADAVAFLNVHIPLGLLGRVVSAWNGPATAVSCAAYSYGTYTEIKKAGGEEEGSHEKRIVKWMELIKLISYTAVGILATAGTLG